MDFCFTSDDHNFLLQNLDEDPKILVLKKKQYPNLNLGLISEQLELRKKALKKAPYFASKNALFVRKSLEQCTPEKVALAKANRWKPSDLQDITAGIGIDAWAFSKFGNVNAWERNEFIHNMAVYNGQLVGNPYPKRVLGNVFDQPEFPFSEWIFVDPDRRPDASKKVGMSALEPNLLNVWTIITQHSKFQLVKLSPAFDISLIANQLTGTRIISVIEWEHSVREICVFAETGFKGIPTIEAWIIENDESKPIKVSDISGEVLIQIPSSGSFVWDPPPSWIKSGLWLQQLSEKGGWISGKNTALGYFASPQKLPGRWFELKAAIPYSKKELTSYFFKNNIKEAMIGRKDFPLAPEVFRSLFKLKEGTYHTIWLVNNKMCLHCCKIANTF